jgi:hypothetical protein
VKPGELGDENRKPNFIFFLFKTAATTKIIIIIIFLFYFILFIFRASASARTVDCVRRGGGGEGEGREGRGGMNAFVRTLGCVCTDAPCPCGHIGGRLRGHKCFTLR